MDRCSGALCEGVENRLHYLLTSGISEFDTWKTESVLWVCVCVLNTCSCSAGSHWCQCPAVSAQQCMTLTLHSTDFACNGSATDAQILRCVVVVGHILMLVSCQNRSCQQWGLNRSGQRWDYTWNDYVLNGLSPEGRGAVLKGLLPCELVR